MAYFKGSASQLQKGSASLSGRNGFVTVKPLEANDSCMVVHSPKGRKYSIWMQQADDSLIGMNMFPRYAMKLVVSGENIHLWIKKFQRSQGRSNTMKMKQTRRYSGASNWSKPSNYSNYRYSR